MLAKKHSLNKMWHPVRQMCLCDTSNLGEYKKLKWQSVVLIISYECKFYLIITCVLKLFGICMI